MFHEVCSPHVCRDLESKSLMEDDTTKTKKMVDTYHTVDRTIRLRSRTIGSAVADGFRESFFWD